MRAGACAVQQTLTSEAASVLKHSLSLARRRGHAQVTPLHVAATLLSSRASLLRRACLKSHPHPTSHPLQCRALELCFNVALNRLPTTPGSLLHSHPSLSNALIAALKRAQAHQRRGCIEQQQQQPLLAIKVELEQLIISILDDPSVSRVMREAGFSSTSVKNNLEDSSSSSVFQCYTTSSASNSAAAANILLPSSCSSPNRAHDIINPSSFWQTHFLNCSSDQNPVLFSTPKKHFGITLFKESSFSTENKEEDLRLVLDVFLRKKKRNTVVVGDSISAVEGLVAELMARVERGDVPDELRSADFIKFQFPSVSLRFMKKEDVETKVADLRRKLGSLASSGGGSGAIIYAGDLKWAVEGSNVNERDGSFFSSFGEVSTGTNYYSPVEHLVTEIGRLLSDYSISNYKVWLIGTANYQTYMKCQTKQPPLEVQWALQPVSVPSGGLGLSLHASSGFDSRMTLFQSSHQIPESKLSMTKEEPEKLTCCAECTSNYEKDAGFFKSGQQKASSLILSSYNSTKDMNKDSAKLPYWMQTHRPDSHQKDDLAELRKKWNRLCHSLHHPRPNQIQTSSLFKNQGSSCKSYTTCAPSYSWWPNGSQFNQSNGFPDSNSISFAESTSKPPNYNSNLLVHFGSQQPNSIEFGFGNGTAQKHLSELSLDSLKDTESKDLKITLALGNSLFTDSLKSRDHEEEKMKLEEDLCKLLQENVPWQSELIPSIAEALLDPKSNQNGARWLMIRGNDWIGKRRLARAIAESLFESSDHLVLMNMRKKINEASSCSRILMEAIEKHKKSVVLIEEIDSADAHFVEFLSNISNNCNVKNQNGREVSFAQSIFILTTGASSSGNDDKNKVKNSVVQMKLQTENLSYIGSPNVNHKRKPEWDLLDNIQLKNPRTDDTRGGTVINGHSSSKRVFSRQSSSNTLDLNIRAEEDDEENNGDGFNRDPSDLTQETMSDHKISLGFIESIENSFVFNQNPAKLAQMTKILASKLKESFEEGIKESERKWCFLVDQVVLEEIVGGSGSFLASLFEKWLKDVFQTSLQTVKRGGKEEVTVRLSLGDKEEGVLKEDGFMGSILPNTIQVAFMK